MMLRLRIELAAFALKAVFFASGILARLSICTFLLTLHLDESKLSDMSLSQDMFRSQIREAKKRLAHLMRDQQKINQETTDLRELIRANANFLPDDEREAELLFLEFFKSPGTITEAVRLAIFVTS